MTRSTVISRPRQLALAVAAVLVALVAWQLLSPHPATTKVGAAPGIVHISMKVTGQKTGVFKGDDNPLKVASGLITVSSYHYELTSPRDAATGQASGKRQHKPLMITHEMGGSSPQFLNALATNENIKEVVINFFRTDRTGKDVNYYRVRLMDASISDVTQYTSGNTVNEDVAFTFRRITQEDFVAKTMFVDDWESPIT